MTKAAFFCVLTKMPYECQTWICMPVVMLLCCTINWSVTKTSRCVCSFICGGCNILKFCIPTKKNKNKQTSTFIASDAVLSAKSRALNRRLGKSCPRAVWLKWANYTAHFLSRWGPRSKVQVRSPSSSGASEREAAREWGDAGETSHPACLTICWEPSAGVEGGGGPMKRSRELQSPAQKSLVYVGAWMAPEWFHMAGREQ